MIASRLQHAVDRAWTGIERAVERGTTESDDAKALAAIKKAFVIRELGPMETQIAAAHGEWDGTGSRRTYSPGESKGLVEIAVSHSASLEALEAVAKAATGPAAAGAGKDAGKPKEKQAVKVSEESKDGAKREAGEVEAQQTEQAEPVAEATAEPDPIATKPFEDLGKDAVAEQLDYVLDTLLTGDLQRSGSAAGLVKSIEAAREDFDAGFEVAPLTAIVGSDVVAGLDASEEAQVKRLLAGGELIATADKRLKGQVLVFPTHPDGKYWHSAVEFKTWWDPDGDQAKVKVVSRLLLDVPDKRYRRAVRRS